MRNPPRSCDLHGGFFAPCGLPKPLPLGEVSPEATERASPARKRRRRSDRQAFYQSDTIAVPVILGQQPSPLSLVALLLASSPKGGAIGMSVRLRLSTTSQSASQTAPLVGEPLAKRRSFPLCQSLSLWEQRRRPPPVAETGRSCWGRGQQDASGSEADAGSRNPGSGIAKQ